MSTPKIKLQDDQDASPGPHKPLPSFRDEDSVSVGRLSIRSFRRFQEDPDAPTPPQRILHFFRDDDTLSLGRISIRSFKRVRDTWGTYFEYIISSIALAVGLGNLFRFPYICQQNGGGVFIISYLVISILVGFPYLLMEGIMGQYFQASIFTIWRICPIFKGIGILNFLVVFWTTSYYMVVLSWTAYYLCASLNFAELPWENCNHSWNTQECVPLTEGRNYSETTSSVVEYYNNAVLQKSDYVFDIGYPQWYLLGVLAILWSLCFSTLFRGIKTLGRIVTIMMIIEIITVIVFLLRTVILPGAKQGVAFLFKPDFTKIALPRVWYQATSQVFFSYSVGFGAVITYNSYNDYHVNIWRASITIALCDSFCCIIFAIMVYSVLGFTAHVLGKPVADLARKGPGLVFSAYPTALSFLPASAMWSLFFFMGAVILGMTSLIGAVQAMVCALEDEQDLYVKYRWQIASLICFLLFLVGTFLTTKAGSYYVDFLDTYSGAGWAVLSLVLLEGFVMAYVYGANKMWENLNDMIGYRVSRVLVFIWLYVSPVILIVVLIFSFATLEFLGKEPGFVWWIDYFGLVFSFSSVAWVPIYMVYHLIREEGSLKERFKRSTTPQLERPRRKIRIPRETALSTTPMAAAQIATFADISQIDSVSLSAS